MAIKDDILVVPTFELNHVNIEEISDVFLGLAVGSSRYSVARPLADGIDSRQAILIRATRNCPVGGAPPAFPLPMKLSSEWISESYDG